MSEQSTQQPPAVSSASAGESESRRWTAPTNQSDRRVLVVDDSAINRKLLRRLLRDRCLVETVDCGDQALRQLSEFRPGVILLDIEMPGLSGYEVCQRIKSSPIGPLTQIVMISSKASTSERLAAYDRGGR